MPHLSLVSVPAQRGLLLQLLPGVSLGDGGDNEYELDQMQLNMKAATKQVRLGCM